jgi:hypothetical protein
MLSICLEPSWKELSNELYVQYGYERIGQKLEVLV